MVTLRLTRRQWATIDGVLDNAANVAIALDEDPATPMAIREAGWAQAPDQPAGQPPAEEPIDISLEADQWTYVTTALTTAQQSIAAIDDPQSLALVNDAAAAVHAGLQTQGNQG